MATAAVPETRRLRVEIRGAVQGVGFRPFVFRLATDLALAGWVINDTRGVFIEVEGPDAALQRFLARLPAEQPPRAIIHSLDASWLPPAGFERFEIRHSDHTGSKTVLVLPDIATCADCLAEVLAPVDRRFRYPFTNCTNCGPRFTIVESLPYDRPNTTMRGFVMCPRCQAEYDDPLDRRFHAQPNACPDCGPRVVLVAKMGGGKEKGEDGSQVSHPLPSMLHPPMSNFPLPTSVVPLAADDEALRRTADALRAGQVVAVKGLGGFHLMVDAADSAAVEALRRRKPRRDKPFALMVRDLAQAAALCDVDDDAAALLASPEAPIVLLPRRADAPVAENVAPGNPTLGVMLAYTPLHHLLLAAFGGPLVATSGNLSDEPICTDADEAVQRLGHIAPLFLIHDRPITRHADDSVAWIVEGTPRLLRRARGFAPLPVMMPQPLPTILAVGAHLKNSVALSVDRQVFISQHIGDLETAEALDAFERVIADFQRLYEARPVAIAHDLHPDYLSTRWAQQQAAALGSPAPGNQGQQLPLPQAPAQPEIAAPAIDHARLTLNNLPLLPVQHHHAHLAACLAENGSDGPALGIIWDGTGYGSDGTVWGGEFLLGDAADFTRVAHLRTFRLPGGDAAVKQPRRVALALLWELYGAEALNWTHLAPVRAFNPEERRLLGQMLARDLNAPLTSSAGRLFDAVAGLIGLHQEVSFEGQAAMALEFAADPAERGAYPVALRPQPGPTDTPANHPSPTIILDWQPLLEALLADLQGGVSSGIMAARFHNGLVDAMVAVAQRVGQPRVALSGGCFQNRLLTTRAAQKLRQVGFEVLQHRQVPPNDGGISLGQIVVAAARLGR